MNIISIFKTNKLKFMIIGFLLVLDVICETAGAYLMTPAFNYIKQNKLHLFLMFIVLSAIVQFIGVILIAIVTILYNQQIQDYIHQIRINISKRIFVKNDEKVSEIQNNLNANLQKLTTQYATPILDVNRRIISLIFLVTALLTLNWSLVTVTLVFSIIGLYLPKAFEKVTAKSTFITTKKNEQLLNTIEKWAQGLNELRRYASFTSYENAIKKANNELKNASIKESFWQRLATVITSLVSIAGTGVLLLLSVYLYATGQIAFGAVVSSGIFSSQIIEAVDWLADSLNQIKSSKQLREDIISLQQPVKLTTENYLNDKIRKIKVKDLKVSFKNGEDIVYPDFTINKGEKVLLTGDSGTGKSTLFKVILGEVKPANGKIIYEDNAGKAFTPAPEKIGYLAQDNILFPDTIRNNITMFDFKLDQTAEKIVEQVKLSDDLKKFPKGIQTFVDLDQDNLSGGQKQKVVLARAKIHNSQLLLIDEGTSAIDQRATKEILTNLLKSDQTIIMIAHNFSQDIVAMFDKEVHLVKEVG